MTAGQVGRGTVTSSAGQGNRQAGMGASLRTVIDCSSDVPGLVRRLLEIPARKAIAGAAGPAGELWFVIGGGGVLALPGQQTIALRPGRGVWVPPGSAYQVRAGRAGTLRADLVELPAGRRRRTPGAPPPARLPLVRDLSDCEVETTGDRRFRVLFGPAHGCPVATQFVGEIPPGRAPDHSHPYDEVVLILQGEGVVHMDGTAQALSPGTCVHLPPGLPHCLENTGTATMRVLGVFHPADSPAAKSS